jgi:O-antigen ligase
MANKSDQTRLGVIIENLIEYVNARLELIKIDFITFGTNITSSLLKLLVIGGLLFVTISFFGFGLAFLLGELLNSFYLGFFIVAVAFGLLAFILSKIWRKKIKPGIMRMFINMLPDEEDQ